MRLGRVLGGLATTTAVAGCAVLVVTMSSRLSPTSDDPATTSDSAVALPTRTLQSSTPDEIGYPTSTTTSRAAPTTSAPPRTTAAPTSHAPTTTAPHTTPARQPNTHTTPKTTSPRKSTTPAPARGVSLPLGYSTGNATRVITVTAPRSSSTTATVQAWQKAPGGGWLKYGGAIPAHIGSQGMTTSPSESKSATPIGTFTLTQAFGRRANPGTGLPYFVTNSADYWISSKSSLYNTHQRCPSSNTGCYNNGVNERLSTIWQYDYAVVINTPSGLSAYPHGSAFFLHITDGGATAGCVAIPQSNLVTLLRWLSPSTHPRILVGVH